MLPVWCASLSRIKLFPKLLFCWFYLSILILSSYRSPICEIFLIFPAPSRFGPLDFLYSHKRGPVLQAHQWIWHQEDVPKHLYPSTEPDQHHHVTGSRPGLCKVRGELVLPPKRGLQKFSKGGWAQCLRACFACRKTSLQLDFDTVAPWSLACSVDAILSQIQP